MTESPSELLTRAADLIRDTAAAATPGPWQACEPWRSGDDYPVYVQTVTTEGYPNADVAGKAVMTEDDGLHGGIAIPNARWIALMSPAVAADLQRWLLEVWKHIRVHDYREDCWMCKPAVAFARTILREDQP